MMMVDDLYSKIQWGKDTWQKSNLGVHIIMLYLTAMNWDLIYSKYKINILLFLNNFLL